MGSTDTAVSPAVGTSPRPARRSSRSQGGGRADHLGAVVGTERPVPILDRSEELLLVVLELEGERRLLDSPPIIATVLRNRADLNFIDDLLNQRAPYPAVALVFLLVHETTIHVRWGELDPYRHVNHATYLSYLEHARIAALESIGWGMEEITATGHQVVVARIDIGFRQPAEGGDELVVQTSLEELRGASSIWRQRIVRGDDVILEAGVTAACTNLEGRPARTPPRFQARPRDVCRDAECRLAAPSPRALLGFVVLAGLMSGLRR